MRIRTSAVMLSLSSGLLIAAEPVRRGTVALTPCAAEGLDRPALCGAAARPRVRRRRRQLPVERLVSMRIHGEED